MSWFDELLMSLVNGLTRLATLLGRYFTGRQLGDRLTSDASFLRQGTVTTRKGVVAPWWSMRPGWQRLLVRLVPILVLAGGLISVWLGVALLVLAVAGAVAVVVRVRKTEPTYAPRQTTSGFDPRPFFDALVPVLGLDRRARWVDWLGVPADILSEFRAQPVYVKLPPQLTLTPQARERIAWTANQHLPGAWEAVWQTFGFAELHPIAEPTPFGTTYGAPAPVAVPDDLSGLPPLAPGPSTVDVPRGGPSTLEFPAVPPQEALPQDAPPAQPPTPAAPQSIEEAFASPPMVIIDGEQAERDR